MSAKQTYTAALPYNKIKGKKDTGRDIEAKSLKEATRIAKSIYGHTVIVIPPYNPMITIDDIKKGAN